MIVDDNGGMTSSSSRLASWAVTVSVFLSTVLAEIGRLASVLVSSMCHRLTNPSWMPAFVEAANRTKNVPVTPSPTGWSVAVRPNTIPSPEISKPGGAVPLTSAVNRDTDTGNVRAGEAVPYVVVSPGSELIVVQLVATAIANKLPAASVIPEPEAASVSR